MINNNTQQVKAYLAGVNLDDPGFDYSMSELAALAEANNYEVVGQASQRVENVVANTYKGGRDPGPGTRPGRQGFDRQR